MNQCENVIELPGRSLNAFLQSTSLDLSFMSVEHKRCLWKLIVPEFCIKGSLMKIGHGLIENIVKRGLKL